MHGLRGDDRVLIAGGEVGVGKTMAAMALGEQFSGVPSVLGFERAYLNT
jgi:hypothetical protein